MSLAEAFAPIDRINREIVLRNTWGHLAPELNQKYQGYIILAKGVTGGCIIFDYNFTDLDDSPWFGQDLSDFAIEETAGFSAPALYRFDGWYKKFKNGNCRFGGGKFIQIFAGGE